MWWLRLLTSFWCVRLHVDQIWLLVEASHRPEIELKDKDEIIREPKVLETTVQQREEWNKQRG